MIRRKTYSKKDRRQNRPNWRKVRVGETRANNRGLRWRPKKIKGKDWERVEWPRK